MTMRSTRRQFAASAVAAMTLATLPTRADGFKPAFCWWQAS
jgi:hypothetical protein